MINLTDTPIFLPATDWDRGIRECIDDVLAEMTRRYGPESTHISWKYPQHAFQWQFRPANLSQRAALSEDFVRMLFEFIDTSSPEGNSQYQARISVYSDNFRTPANGISSLKSGVKMLLALMWSRKLILLPTSLLMGSYFKPIPDGNELLSFSYGFNPKSFAVSANRQMYQYMPRIIRCTTWQKIEDVCIFEVSELHKAHREFQANTFRNRFCASPVPWFFFLTQLLERFPSRVRFSRADLVAYSTWAQLDVSNRVPFATYLEDFVLMPKAPGKGGPAGRDAPIMKRLPKPKTLSQPAALLTSTSSHEAIVNYFAALSNRNRGGFEWMRSPTPYDGREHIDVTQLSTVWYRLFSEFLHHRIHMKGFESDKGIHSALNIFADYLFLYLPWWNELFPESPVCLPLSPAGFSRYIFVKRSGDLTGDRLPSTFFDMVKLRRLTPGSQRAAISVVHDFFDFVLLDYGEDVAVVGSAFKNPISKKFDIPKARVPKKTTKVPFSKVVYPYLLSYGYAVEAFGEWLQGLCQSGELNANVKKITNALWLDASEFGYIPFVRYRGKITPLLVVPNVFNYFWRNFGESAATVRTVFIPHLTRLRLLVGAIEVGLRLMGLKWLDRRTWDKDNDATEDISSFSFIPKGSYTYNLHVCTDMTKDEAWDTVIVFRVRSLLLREQRFQLSILDCQDDEAVPYEGRANSRFADIVPLFRSAASNNAVDEYADCWVVFLTGFQSFFFQATGSSNQFISLKPILCPRTKVPKVVVEDRDMGAYCPLSVKAINTPHACRATFATNK